MRYENVIFLDSVGFHCKGCGVCCRDQPPDINQREQQKIEEAGFTDFLEAPVDPNNRSLRRSKNGSCIFLTQENACKIQNIKPFICVLEPFVIADFKYETNKIFVTLNPIAAKNCQGICNGETVDLEGFGKAAQAIVRNVLEIVAEKNGLLVTDKKTAVIARKLLRS